MALGVASFIVPLVISPPLKFYESPLFPIVRTSVEQMGFLTFSLLFAGGLVFGLLFRRSSALCAATMLLWLPVVAIAEMVVDPTSHNLFPIEFGLYAVFSIVPMFGAWLGGQLHRLRPA